jgi:hypothetical protein
MRVMDDSASTAEQAHYAQRLIAAGERLQRRADEAVGTVIAGEVLKNGLAAPGPVVTGPQTGSAWSVHPSAQPASERRTGRRRIPGSVDLSG